MVIARRKAGTEPGLQAVWHYFLGVYFCAGRSMHRPSRAAEWPATASAQAKRKIVESKNPAR
jgi:hypothetical protein